MHTPAGHAQVVFPFMAALHRGWLERSATVRAPNRRQAAPGDVTRWRPGMAGGGRAAHAARGDASFQSAAPPPPAPAHTAQASYNRKVSLGEISSDEIPRAAQAISSDPTVTCRFYLLWLRALELLEQFMRSPDNDLLLEAVRASPANRITPSANHNHTLGESSLRSRRRSRICCS